MKTSIFNMNFTLPPLVEMVEVEKEMPTATHEYVCSCLSLPYCPGPWCDSHC